LGNLQANSAGTTRFNSTVNASRLSTDADGETQLNGNVTTNGIQSYGDNLRLDNSISLTSNNANISFAGTVDSQTGETNALTVNQGLGNTTFSNAVGSNTAVGNVAIANSGSLTLNSAANMNLAGAFLQNGTGAISIGSNITTTNANITFNGPVTQTGDVALTAGTGTITFNSSWAAGDNPLALSANEMNFLGGASSVTGTNTLTLSQEHRVWRSRLVAMQIAEQIS
jgi:hypothetical protein